MKKVLSLTLMLSFSLLAFAQTVDYLKLEFKSATDYKKYQPEVLDAANLILSGPTSKNKTQKQDAGVFLLLWMTGTPDYSFELSEEMSNFTKKDKELVRVYLAALVKGEIDDSISKTGRDVFLDYCVDPANKATISKAVKKALKARG